MIIFFTVYTLGWVNEGVAMAGRAIRGNQLSHNNNNNNNNNKSNYNNSNTTIGIICRLFVVGCSDKKNEDINTKINNFWDKIFVMTALISKLVLKEEYITCVKLS